MHRDGENLGSTKNILEGGHLTLISINEQLTYNEALFHHCAKLIVDKNRIQYITKVKIETRFHNRKHVYNFI